MEEQRLIVEYDKKFNWKKYNLSQAKEKHIFLNILNDLCNSIIEPMNQIGRKPTPLKDIVFAIVLKEYLNTSARRLQSDLNFFSEIGFIKSEIPFTTLLGHLDKRELRSILIELIEISSLPFKKIEQDFAIDSTGFSTSRYVTYFDVKHRKNSKWKAYRKCHAVCGVKTNIITAIDITNGYVNDQTRFIPLAEDTSRNFKIRDFTADRGYLSAKNFKRIEELGGMAYIPFKKNTSGKVAQTDRSYFKRAFKYFKENKEEYLKHYHKRSNIESSFSMIKRKFGNNVKCKKEISQDNEILAKVLAHNICVIIQEIFINNLNINFYYHIKHYVERN